MSDEKAVESSSADLFYKPSAESAPAKEETTETSESVPDTKSEEQSESASGSEPEKTQESTSPKAEKRISQLIAKNKALEAELAEIKKTPAPKIEKVTPPEFPDANKYETLDALRVAEKDYYDKQTQLAIQQALEKDRVERAKEAQDSRIKEINQNIEKIWQKRENATMKRHSDYAETVYDDAGKIAVRVNSAADGFILDSEIGPEILFHLAKHPDEAEALMEMTPWATARELTKLEQKINDGLKAPKRVTSAPPPPDNVGGRGAVVTTPRPLEEIFYGKS